MKQIGILITVMLLICSASFANEKRQMTPQQKQIYQNSMAVKQRRNLEANRTQRQLYRLEKYKNSFQHNYALYFPRRIRHASYGWYDRLYGAGSYANALAKDQLISDDIARMFLNFLELHTSQLDVTKELPSSLVVDAWIQKPLVNKDFVQEEIMPLGDMWELRDVWYKPEVPTATEVVKAEDGKKYLAFKSSGDVMLRTFTLQKGTIYTWRVLVHVVKDDSDVVKLLPADVQEVTPLDNAVSSGQDNARFYAERSGVYWKMKQYDKALADMKNALELEPDKAEYYENVAAIYIEQEEYDNALPYINKAIELNPNNGRAYIFRGYIHMKRHRNDLYQADFRQARKLGEKV